MASMTSSHSQTSGRTVSEDEDVQLCRICNEACRSAKDIFTHQDPGILIYEIIDDICQLRIFPGDGLSRYVCTSCHQSVLQFYRFKRSAQEGQAALKYIRKFGEPNRSGARCQESGDADECAESGERRRSTNNLCRLCVKVSQFYRNIFMQKHHGIYFYKIINELCSVNVAVGDNFPAWVCQGCHTSVIEFYKFKRLAHYKNSSALSRRSANPSPGYLTGLRLRSEESLLERRGGQIGDSQPGDLPARAPRPVSVSTAEADRTFPSNGDVGSEDTGAHDSSADDEDDLDDYLEWLEYQEFTDFIDGLPCRGSGDGGCLEASILRDMREAPSAGGVRSGAAQRAKELRELLERRRRAMKASQASWQRLCKLRMMRMKEEIGLKEQKVRHMREMMALRKKISESKEGIEKMKAKSKELNEWRESIEKKDGTSSVIEKDSLQTTAHGMDVAVELPGNLEIKEEPRDYIDIDELPIKEECSDESVHNEETIVAANEDEAITANTSGDGRDENNSRKRQHVGSEGEEVSERRRKIKRRSSCSTETLRLAVEAVASKQLTVWKAANHYSIPFSVLRDYVKISQESGYISSLPSNDTTVDFNLSTENEDKLVKFFTEMNLRGFGVCPERMRQMAYALALEGKNGHEVGQHHPSDSWLEDFCFRHGLNLSTLTDPKMQPSYHADSTVLTTFYDKIRLLYDRLGIVISPRQVWNCDETSLSCVSSDGSVVARVGRRNACGIGAECNGELRVSTVLTCSSASGDVGPTMVVFKGEGEDSSLSCRDVMIASTKTGCIDHGTFGEWFNKFSQEVHVDQPVVLLVDSQNNHLSPQVIDAAVERGVILVTVDFLASGSLQPVEVSIMHPLHDVWRRYLEEFQQGNAALVPRYRDFLSWFPSALHTVAVEDGIIAGFCKTGIYPPHQLVLKNATASRAELGEQEGVPSMKFDETGFEQRLAEFILGLRSVPQS